MRQFWPIKRTHADALLAFVDSKGTKAIIPPKATRKTQRTFDQYQCGNRNVIESFFVKPKRLRRIVTRFNKLASRFISFIAFAASVIWLK
jgi:transposase